MSQYEEILKRLEKLEKAVFEQGKVAAKKPANFAGPSGGIKFLLTKTFFNKKQSAAAVRKELEQNGYHYPIAAVQTALNRASVKGGRLNSLKENGLKVYVARK